MSFSALSADLGDPCGYNGHTAEFAKIFRCARGEALGLSVRASPLPPTFQFSLGWVAQCQSLGNRTISLLSSALELD